jgi:hypothetical protein
MKCLGIYKYLQESQWYCLWSIAIYFGFIAYEWPCTYKFSPMLQKNTLHLFYIDQTGNGAWRTNCCLFWELCRVWIKCRDFVNEVVRKVTNVLQICKVLEELSVGGLSVLFQLKCEIYLKCYSTHTIQLDLLMFSIMNTVNGVTWIFSSSGVQCFVALHFRPPSHLETLIQHHNITSWKTSILFFIIKPTRCTNFSNLFWNENLHVLDSSSVHHQELFTVYSAMVYVIQVCRQLLSRIRMELSVHKPVWHIPLLSVQWITPNYGERNCLKHVELHSKINLRN